MKYFIIKLGGIMASLALAVVSIDANISTFYYHQAKLPEEAKKLRKF